MRAYHLDGFGSVDGLAVREHEIPKPGPHEVLVKVGASSLNYRDLLVLNNAYPFPTTPGVVPLSDGAGEVVSVGNGVSRVAVGDRVASIYFQRFVDGRLTLQFASEQNGCVFDGLLTEYRVLSEEALVKVPSHLSFEEAATLPCAALTAWSGVNGPRGIVPGETVLTIGSGGVALFAIQFAKAFGAKVISVTSSEDRIDRLKQIGADEVIGSRSNPDWEEAVRKVTGGRGADHIVETVGPATLERSLKAAAFDGQIALIGVFANEGQTLNARMFSVGPISLRRIGVGSRAAFEAMNRAIEQHRIRPVIDRTFKFDEAKDAYRYFQGKGHFGKVVISHS